MMADLCISYYNSGSVKITNIKPGFSMERLTWRSVTVKFWSATIQNNAPLYMISKTILQKECCKTML